MFKAVINCFVASIFDQLSTYCLKCFWHMANGIKVIVWCVTVFGGSSMFTWHSWMSSQIDHHHPCQPLPPLIPKTHTDTLPAMLISKQLNRMFDCHFHVWLVMSLKESVSLSFSPPLFVSPYLASSQRVYLQSLVVFLLLALFTNFPLFECFKCCFLRDTIIHQQQQIKCVAPILAKIAANIPVMSIWTPPKNVWFGTVLDHRIYAWKLSVEWFKWDCLECGADNDWEKGVREREREEKKIRYRGVSSESDISSFIVII